MKVAGHFDARQIRDFVKQTKAEAGCGWAMLGNRIQEALIAERALCILGGQASETIPTDLLHSLRLAMLVEAGLHEWK